MGHFANFNLTYRMQFSVGPQDSRTDLQSDFARRLRSGKKQYFAKVWDRIPEPPFTTEHSFLLERVTPVICIGFAKEGSGPPTARRSAWTFGWRPSGWQSTTSAFRSGTLQVDQPAPFGPLHLRHFKLRFSIFPRSREISEHHNALLPQGGRSHGRLRHHLRGVL